MLNVEKSKRHYRTRSVPINYRDWQLGGGHIPFHQEVEREPLLKIYISEDNYTRLIESERRVEELDYRSKELESLRHKLLVEAEIRRKNPALQKAWEKYQMVLGLVENG